LAGAATAPECRSGTCKKPFSSALLQTRSRISRALTAASSHSGGDYVEMWNLPAGTPAGEATAVPEQGYAIVYEGAEYEEKDTVEDCAAQCRTGWTDCGYFQYGADGSECYGFKHGVFDNGCNDGNLQTECRGFGAWDYYTIYKLVGGESSEPIPEPIPEPSPAPAEPSPVPNDGYEEMWNLPAGTPQDEAGAVPGPGHVEIFEDVDGPEDVQSVDECAAKCRSEWAGCGYFQVGPTDATSGYYNCWGFKRGVFDSGCNRNNQRSQCTDFDNANNYAVYKLWGEPSPAPPPPQPSPGPPSPAPSPLPTDGYQAMWDLPYGGTPEAEAVPGKGHVEIFESVDGPEDVRSVDECAAKCSGWTDCGYFQVGPTDADSGEFYCWGFKQNVFDNGCTDNNQRFQCTGFTNADNYEVYKLWGGAPSPGPDPTPAPTPPTPAPTQAPVGSIEMWSLPAETPPDEAGSVPGNGHVEVFDFVDSVLDSIQHADECLAKCKDDWAGCRYFQVGPTDATSGYYSCWGFKQGVFDHGCNDNNQRFQCTGFTAENNYAVYKMLGPSYVEMWNLPGGTPHDEANAVPRGGKVSGNRIKKFTERRLALDECVAECVDTTGCGYFLFKPHRRNSLCIGYAEGTFDQGCTSSNGRGRCKRFIEQNQMTIYKLFRA